MSDSSVSLAEVLRIQGRPLNEEEVWALLLAASEHILKDFEKHSNKWITISPWSLMLSDSGNVYFHTLVHPEASPFRAPEIFQVPTQTKELMVYSLGMTLYWSVEYSIPAHQPVDLGQKINSILILMCEKSPQLRPSPEIIIQKCMAHQTQLSLPSSAIYIKGLVNLVLGDICQSQTHRPGSKDWTGLHHHVQNQVSDCNTSCSCCKCEPLTKSTAFLRRSYLSQDKIFHPEFVVLAKEPPVTLMLPAKIVTKKGKSYLSESNLYVIIPNGLCLEMKCDLRSRVSTVLESAANYIKLEKPFYFGLAYMKGKEFFFLDDDDVLENVAPKGWSKTSRKKSTIVTFTLFLRIKYFVHDFIGLRHSATKHLIYLQLRKDILEERLFCSRDTALYMGSLALQNEVGDYSSEFHEIDYFSAEDFLPPRILETPQTAQELEQLHQRLFGMLREEAEMAFLQVARQLPEYGVFFHHVLLDKKSSGSGDYALGICCHGIILYEERQGIRISNLHFPWREIQTLSSHKKKFTVKSCSSGKKHSFYTDSKKTSKYLLVMCSTLQSFQNNLRRLCDKDSFEGDMEEGEFEEGNSTYTFGDPFEADPTPSADGLIKVVLMTLQITNNPEEGQSSSVVFQRHMSWMLEAENSISSYDNERYQMLRMQRMSCSENVLCSDRYQNLRYKILSKSCDNMGWEETTEEDSMTAVDSKTEIHKQSSDYLSVHSNHNDSFDIQSNQKATALDGMEREIIRVKLKRDPKFGLGFVIIGGEIIGKLDLGIFVASVIPGGPAELDGRIKPGGRLISMNNVSLEGMSFNSAVQILQECGEEAELILSQPKAVNNQFHNKEGQSSNASWEGSQTGSVILDTLGSTYSDLHSHPPCLPCDPRNKEIFHKCSSNEPNLTEGNGDQNSSGYQSVISLEKSFTELKTQDVFCVQLKREFGSLGFSVTGGINTSVRHGGIYVKSIAPQGPASLNGQIKRGDRLLQVNTVHMQGFTHRQAVEFLKNSGEEVTLLLQRGGDLEYSDARCGRDFHESARTTPNYSESECPSFITKDNTFQVTLKKNSGGLGFSFMQTEIYMSGSAEEFIRIKRLFEGQPAQENGHIRPGDVLLAVNGKPIRGLNYQEVFHLLHSAPLQVTLTICRPNEGVLPDMDFSAPTPLPSPVRDLLRVKYPAHDFERNLSTPLEKDRGTEEVADTSQKFFCSHLSKPIPVSDVMTALEKDVRVNSYSTFEMETQESLKGERAGTDIREASQELSDEEYLTISSTSVTPSSCGQVSEELTAIHDTPQSVPLPESFTSLKTCDSENEWEDLEESEEYDQGSLMSFKEVSTEKVPFVTIPSSPYRRFHLPLTSSRKVQVPVHTKQSQISSNKMRSKAPSPVRHFTPSPHQ
ncbi:FERM and PDZ domain-containing protein 2 [Rhinophrynus dorsalis]